MRLVTGILILALIGGASWYTYPHWHPKLAHLLEARTKPTFPVDRVLTDRTGRKVAARLVARSALELQFVRQSDGAVYHYPITSLSEEDQHFVQGYPESRLDQLVRGGTPESTGSPAASQLRVERAGLQHRIELMKLELGKKNSKSPILSSDQIQLRIDDCQNQIIDIDKQLLELAFRSSGP